MAAKKRRRDETNELAKSCGVLHVVTCREPAGLDQSPETKGPRMHDAQRQPETGLVAQPKAPKRF